MSTTVFTQFFLLFAVACVHVSAKQYSRCELAEALKNNGIRESDIGTWVCLAESLSSIETNTATKDADGTGYHGLFLVSDRWWCNRGNRGCGQTCAKMKATLDSNIKCAKKVFDETNKMKGDGFEAWSGSYPKCKEAAASYVTDCGLSTGGTDIDDEDDEFEETPR